MTSSSVEFRRSLGDLAWSLWTELGVRGVERQHRSWSIDPEALIILTASLADADPRLRDESLDWCLRNQRYISRGRLRTVARDVVDEGRNAYERYVATLSRAGTSNWPAEGTPWPFTPTAKSELADLKRAALIRIRLRAIFGVSARAEIFHALMAEPTRWTASAELAALAGYTKRNIDEELENLERAGVVEAAPSGNRRLVRLADPPLLTQFVGPAPKHFPDWILLVKVLVDVEHLLRQWEGAKPQVQDVEASRLLEDLGSAAIDASLPPPPPPGPSAWEQLNRWALRLGQQLAGGAPPPARGRPRRLGSAA